MPVVKHVAEKHRSIGVVPEQYPIVVENLHAAMRGFAASLLFNRAGERAARESHGPGSFQTEFLDALWAIDADTVSTSTVLEVSR